MSAEWVVMSNREDYRNVGRCLRCGMGLALKLPMPVGDFIALVKRFVEQHEGCPSADEREDADRMTPQQLKEYDDVMRAREGIHE